MLVLKFGGAALADAAKIQAAAACVAAWKEARPVVVVSAAKGVTDQLLAAHAAAASGDEAAAVEARRVLEVLHRRALEGLVPAGPARDEVRGYLDARLGELEGTLRALAVLGEATDRSRAYVAAMGERLSSRLVAAALRQAGLGAEAVDGEEVVVTEGAYAAAYADEAATYRRIAMHLRPLLEAGRVPVVMGFVGADARGVTTTLGRGGTDLTASLVAAGLGAAEVRYMKEVDGIMTADPRRVPDARRLEVLTYEEVAELSYFGAKVLHPVAIHPLRQRGIPATIRDVRDPEATGTRVVAAAEGEAVGAKALTAIDDVGLLTVAGGGLQGVPGVAGRVFTALARADVNVLLISQGSSEQSISLVVPHEQAAAAAEALQAEFELERLKGRVDDVAPRTGVAVVAVVGDGMRGMPGVAGRIFSALGGAGVNVVLIAQGSSERNISFLVSRDELASALQALHDAFGLGEARA